MKIDLNSQTRAGYVSNLTSKLLVQTSRKMMISYRTKQISGKKNESQNRYCGHHTSSQRELS